jgi:L-fuculose-phosphate aldolase
MSQWTKEKQEVLDAAGEMLVKNLVIGSSGNVSCRLPSGDRRLLIAITPSSISYESMLPDDIQVVNAWGETVEGNLTPSTETRLHIAIYQSRKDIKAVMHTHSVFASAVSVTGESIPPVMEDQVAVLGGEIKLARHAFSGTQEQIDGVIKALENRNAALLPNHGAVGIGRTLPDTLTACQLIEKTAKIFLLARLAGKVVPLPPEILQAMQAVFRKNNG